MVTKYPISSNFRVSHIRAKERSSSTELFRLKSTKTTFHLMTKRSKNFSPKNPG